MASTKNASHKALASSTNESNRGSQRKNEGLKSEVVAEKSPTEVKVNRDQNVATNVGLPYGLEWTMFQPHPRELITMTLEALRKRGMNITKRCVRGMLTRYNRSWELAVDAISRDIISREQALSESGRISFDKEDYPYSINLSTGQSVYTHADRPDDFLRDEMLEILEKHNADMIEWEAKGRSCRYAKELENDFRYDSVEVHKMSVMYDVEAKLLGDRGRLYVKAKAEGQMENELKTTMRDFDKSAANAEWVNKLLEPLVAMSTDTSFVDEQEEDNPAETRADDLKPFETATPTKLSHDASHSSSVKTRAQEPLMSAPKMRKKRNLYISTRTRLKAKYKAVNSNVQAQPQRSTEGPVPGPGEVPEIDFESVEREQKIFATVALEVLDSVGAFGKPLSVSEHVAQGDLLDYYKNCAERLSRLCMRTKSQNQIHRDYLVSVRAKYQLGMEDRNDIESTVKVEER